MKLIVALVASLVIATSAYSQQRSFKDFIREPAFVGKAAGDSLDFATSMRFDSV